MAKRSSITAERKDCLLRDKAVYTIKCTYPECPCHDGQDCARGFFSLFIQAIYGIDFANRFGLPHYINFGDKVYPYSDSNHSKDRNFWNYYFKQDLDSNEPGYHYCDNDYFENYPLRIWSKKHFNEIHKIVSSLKLRVGVQQAFDEVDNLFKDKKVLGIHLRGTDHIVEVKPPSFEKILRKIDSELKKGKSHLFLATDEEAILNKLIDIYGDKLIYHPFTRSKTKDSLHIDSKHSGFDLGIQALTDCYTLSQCEHSLLYPSNLSYAALFFNPHLSYSILESQPAMIKRYRTLFAYYMNRLGIRKW